MQPYRIFEIRQGTVIDHLVPGSGSDIIRLLGLNRQGLVVTLGMNLPSKKLKGPKDIVKIERQILNQEELERIAIVSPGATVSFIDQGKVVKKIKIILPAEIVNSVFCPNRQCISRSEPVESKFIQVSKGAEVYRCYFCEREFTRQELLMID